MPSDLLERLVRESSPEAALSMLPDSVTLAERFCGMRLYPRQKTLLRMFCLELDKLTDYDKMVIDEWMRETVDNGDVRIPLDFYERAQKCIDAGYRNFREIINCFGRRGGKGFFGGILGTRKILELIALGNPQAYYGIDEGKDILSPIVATTVSQAQRLLYSDIKNTVMRCTLLRPFITDPGVFQFALQTPHDRDVNQTMSGRFLQKARRQTIKFKPSAASSSSGRGDAAMFVMFDEFAFLSSNTESSISSDEVYSAYTPSLDQFGKDALIYIPSSPYSEVGKFYELYNSAFEQDEFGHPVNWNMLAVRMPSWASYEDWEYDGHFRGAIQYSPDVNEQMRLLEQRDPEKFKVERRAHFQSVIDAYMDPAQIDRIFEPCIVNGEDRNVEHKVGRIDRVYHAHGDAAKVNDNFCYAIGHGEPMSDGTTHAFIDLMLVWQASDFDHSDDPDDMMPYMDYNEIYEQISMTLRNFYIDKLTFDQFDSTMMLQRLQKDVIDGKSFNHNTRCVVENFTAASNLQRYERFKTAVGQGWVHAPEVVHNIKGLGKVCVLKHELKFLTRVNNRVDHPPGGHNDMADCVSEVVNRIIGDQVSAFESGLFAAVDGANGNNWELGGYRRDSDADRIIARGQKLMSEYAGLFDEFDYGERF